MGAERATSGPEPSRRYSPAQQRVIAAALDLFAERGVGGTSLQMIADALGVRKGAVWQNFNAKDEIVIAAAETLLTDLRRAIESAEAQPTPARARDALVVAIVDLAVNRRRLEGTLLADPVIARYFAHHESLHNIKERQYAILMAGSTGPDARASAAMLSAAIGGAVMHPFAADLDDETLRTQLLQLTRGFLRKPPTRSRQR